MAKVSGNKHSKPSALKAKEARRADKEATKYQNIERVEASKANKPAPVSSAPKKPVKEPDVWQRIAMERRGVTMEETENKAGKKTFTKRKVTATANRPSHHWQKGCRKQCVVTNKGDHQYLKTVEAQKVVAAGGRFIPKWQYKGTIQHPKDGRIKPDWRHKNTKAA